MLQARGDKSPQITRPVRGSHQIKTAQFVRPSSAVLGLCKEPPLALSSSCKFLTAIGAANEQGAGPEVDLVSSGDSCCESRTRSITMASISSWIYDS